MSHQYPQINTTGPRHVAAKPMWGKTREEIITSACSKLKEILAYVCETHGYSHSIAVMDHCEQALASHSGTEIPECDQILILLAALCHDADDYKFWKNSDNTSHILLYCSDGLVTNEQETFVHEMISYVGCSTNGNRIPEAAVHRPELLYPRYSDRLEALGEVGLGRTYVYTVKHNTPLFTETTPRPKSEDELWKYATHERTEAYRGQSESMMDHFYDKLLHIGNFETDNGYLKSMANDRSRIMIEACLHYGITGSLHPLFSNFKVVE